MNDTSAYQPYVEASWGLMNHWYPALFSRELTDDGLIGVQLAGVPILLRRLGGTVASAPGGRRSADGSGAT